ncbi:MAG: transporter substrate-binding domain-containing protein [Pseudobutyrivibrio sp.]|nr:transporter substrate-binding domain-containing protein [Pseudobutyrivibrio sp.]
MRMWGVKKFFIIGVVAQVLFMAMPSTAVAAGSEEIVRVGMFDSIGFSTVDEYGKRTGYGYDYIQEIAYRAGWKLEYVDGGFGNLMNKLESGEIDIMMNVSKTPERQEKFLFSDQPQGEEVYYIYVNSYDSTINADDISSLNGATIGCDAGSYTQECVINWAADNGIELNYKEYTDKKDWDDLTEGRIQGMAATDMSLLRQAIPAFKVGASDFYFAVNKDRPDLMEDLNAAHEALLRQRPGYNGDLKYNYYREKDESARLTSEEMAWIEENPNVRIGFLNHYMPYCGLEDGKVIGILATIIEEVEEKTGLSCQLIPYDSIEDMTTALENKEVAAIYPWIMDYSYSESKNYSQSFEIFSVPELVVYKGDYKQDKFSKLAVLKNYASPERIQIEYPDAEIIEYDTIDACLKAVDTGKVDALFSNSYRLNAISSNLSNYPGQTVVLTGKSHRVGFAFDRSQTQILSAFNSVILSLNLQDINNFLVMDSQDQDAYRLGDFMRDYGWLIVSFIGLCAIVAVVLTYRKLVKESEDKEALAIANKKLQATKMELSEALSSSEKANQSKVDFISRISHDIRTPLSAVWSMAEFAFDDINEPEKLQKDLKQIQSSSAFLTSILNDILDVSKIDSGRITLNPEPYNYGKYIEDFEGLVRAAATEKKVELDIVNVGEDLTVLIDPVRYRQITLNVVMNAISYTPAGGKVTIKTGVTAAGNNGHCKLVVEDTGIGMSQEYMSHLFEPFRQDDVNPERRKLAGGTGLGLYIVKRLVGMMNGHIEIESQMGKGTTVSILITAPLCKDDNAKEGFVAQIRREFNLSGQILLAEDNEINAEITARLVESLGCTVDHVWNGNDAVEKFKNAKEGYYKAILMDIQMPLMNGYDASLAIRAMDREDAKHIPIIAMTADAFDSAKAKAKECGMDVYVTKPLNIEKVKSILSELIINSGI